MIASNDIERRIKQALPGSQVNVKDITGCSDHFQVQVVAHQFEGQSAIQRHRMVYDSLGDLLGGPLHALSLATRTPSEIN